MHPSGPPPSAGAHNPMHSQNPRTNQAAPRARSQPEGGFRNDHGAPPPQSSDPAGSWFFSDGLGTPAGGKAGHSGVPVMMGASGSFFTESPTRHEQQQEGGQYDWMNTFEPAQARDTQFSAPSSTSYSFHQQNQFASAPVHSQYSSSRSGATPQTHMSSGTFDTTSSYSPQGSAGLSSFASYIPSELFVPGRSDLGIPSPQAVLPQQRYPGSSPGSTHHSYTNTPDPAPSHHSFDGGASVPGQAQAHHHQQPQAQPQAHPHSASGLGSGFPHHQSRYPTQSTQSSSTQSSTHSAPSWTARQAPPQPKPVQQSQPAASNFQFKVHYPPEPSASGPSTAGPSYLSAQSRPVPATTATEVPQAAPTGPSISQRKTTGKRKRARREESGEWSEGEDLSDWESDEEDAAAPDASPGGKGARGGKGKQTKQTRLPGACKHCKKLKMKCDFPRGEDMCKRCKSTGHQCIVEGRKPRTAPNKREYLLAQIRQKDAIIESLIKQIHNPYSATPMSIASFRMATSPSDQNNGNVVNWLERMQSSVRDAGSRGGPQAFAASREKKDDESDHEDEPGMAQDDDNNDNMNDSRSDTISEEGIRSSLPEAHVPLGLIANLSLSNSATSKKKDPAKDAIAMAEEDFNDDDVGVANETYFMPGPATDLGIRATLIEQHSPPELLVHNLVTWDEVQKLFDIFYKYINPFVSLLDPVLHNPTTTFNRCPFLFTVVCAIASRYYTEKSEIYPIAMHFAKRSAATALIDGWKSVELCQAYILMSIYSVPARRWEEDRSWLYTGLAIRIATDLNLHLASSMKPTSEKQERELLNKTRVWMICFNLDRSTATQFGKPSTIKEDFIIMNSKEWYRKSKYNHPFDIQLCGHSCLLQLVAKFHDKVFSDPSNPTRLNKRVDFRSVTLEHDGYLTAFHQEWEKRFAEDSATGDPGSAFRCRLLPFLVSYSRLVMFSFGFQQAFQRGLQPGDEIFVTKCLESAKGVIESMVDSLATTEYMRYAPDGHFVFAAFASAFLLKLLRPELSHLISKSEETEIFDLIGRLIQTLRSPNIAIDDRHTPKLYARFLAGLLSKHRPDGATVGRLQTQAPPPQDRSGSSSGSAFPGSSFFTQGQSSGSMPSGSVSGGGASGMGGSYNYAPNPSDSIIYMPEATFATGTTPINFGPGELTTFDGTTFSEEETLATMRAISHPGFWKDMMMPGFSWPEASPSPPASHPSSSGSPFSSSGSQSGYNANHNNPMSYMTGMPGASGTFGMFHIGSQVPLH